MIKNKTVAIIGAGMMGSALSFPLNNNGYRVHLVGTPFDNKIIDECVYTHKHPGFNKSFSDNIEFYKFYEWITFKDDYKYDFIICGVSSMGVDWFLNEILYKLDLSVPVLSITKGLLLDENNDIISYPIFWRKKLLKHGIDRHICAIGGPSTSYELACGDYTEVTIVGENNNDLKLFRDALQTDYYHVNISNDIIGIETMVALKNVYTLAVTATIGENNKKIGDNNIHYNSQAAIFAQSCKEMALFLDIVNGDKNSLFVGIGDLYVTLYGGRTRRLGILLGEGKTLEESLKIMGNVTLESVTLIKRLTPFLDKLKKENKINDNEFPILNYVYELINKKNEYEKNCGFL